MQAHIHFIYFIPSHVHASFRLSLSVRPSVCPSVTVTLPSSALTGSSCLQVLEMVASVSPEVFTDWERKSAELHIARLFQVHTSLVRMSNSPQPPSP